MNHFFHDKEQVLVMAKVSVFNIYCISNTGGISSSSVPSSQLIYLFSFNLPRSHMWCVLGLWALTHIRLTVKWEEMQPKPGTAQCLPSTLSSTSFSSMKLLCIMRLFISFYLYKYIKCQILVPNFSHVWAITWFLKRYFLHLNKLTMEGFNKLCHH